jgi:hypothetical protein
MLEAMTAPLDPKLGTTQYRMYRDQIRDGDVLCFSGRHWLSSFIRKLSHGSYSHGALAFWWGERLMVLQAEARPGVQALPASRAIGNYNGSVEWHPLKAEYRTPQFEQLIAEIAMSRLGDPYSILDLVEIGLHYAIGTPLPKESRTQHTFVCSQYVAHCYSKAHLDLQPKRPDIGTTPEDLATSRYLGTPVRLKD